MKSDHTDEFGPCPHEIDLHGRNREFFPSRPIWRGCPFVGNHFLRVFRIPNPLPWINRHGSCRTTVELTVPIPGVCLI
jgi:hypothetical protein